MSWLIRNFEEDPAGVLTRQYPSLKSLAGPPGKARETAWIAAFTQRPEALETLLSDLIKQVYSKPGRIGQKPMPREEDVNFDALLHGEYTDRPIAEILPQLMGRTSAVVFAARVWLSRKTFQRIFLPESHPLRHWPTAAEVERIAAVTGKPPAFFVEYRLMAAQAAFLNLIMDRPVVATRLYRDYLEVARESPFGVKVKSRAAS